MDFLELEEWVIRAKSGEFGSKEKILEAFKPCVFKQANKYKIPSYDFEDLINEGYGALLKSIDVYIPGKGSFASFCKSFIENNFKVLLRNSKIRDSRVEYTDVIYEREDGVGSPLEQIVENDCMDRLMRAVGELSEDEFELVSFVYFKGNTLQAFAKKHGISYSRARWRKEGILKKVREGVER